MLRCSIGILLCVMLSPALAQTRPAMNEEENEVRLSVGSDTEYQPLLDELDLDDATRAAVQEKIDHRRRQLRAFVEGERGKLLVAKREELRQARIAKNNNRVSELRREIQPLSDEYWKLRHDTRRAILETLPPEKFKQYVGLELARRASRPFSRIELTDQQRAAIAKLAQAKAETHVTNDLLATDPFFRSLDPLVPDLQRAIMDDLLTPKQRIALRDRRATTQSATEPSTQPR